MLRVFKSQAVRYFTYGFIDIEDPFFGYIDYGGLNIFLCRPARFLFYQVAKIVR